MYSTQRMLLAFFAMIILGAAPHNLAAQDSIVVGRDSYPPQRLNWGTYDPYYAVTSRVYAQSELIRAQGAAAVDFSLARNLNAIAYSQELDNWVKEVRSRWEREIEGELGRMELNRVRQIRRLEYLNDRKWQNSRTWNRLKNHPELSNASIANADALNFLLDRLGASALPYEFDPFSSRFSSEVIQQLRLDSDTLANLTLLRGSYSFPASQELQEDVLWPYLLRWDEFELYRHDYESARLDVVAESEASGQVSVAAIQKLHDTLQDLSDRFHGSTRVRSWVREHIRFSQFRASERFLWNLEREITQLEATGDIRPFQGREGYDPRTDGDHVLSLLCFMNRNGLEFGPAQPGSEFAYHRLFTLMRAVYLTVADQDESIRPEDLSLRRQQELGNDPETLTVFRASWCPACSQFTQDLADNAEFRASLNSAYRQVRYVDVDESPELAQRYSIREVPTFVAGGKRVTGYADPDSLLEELGVPNASVNSEPPAL